MLLYLVQVWTPICRLDKDPTLYGEKSISKVIIRLDIKAVRTASVKSSKRGEFLFELVERCKKKIQLQARDIPN